MNYSIIACLGSCLCFWLFHPHIWGWQAVVIFPRRSLEPDDTKLHETLLSSRQVQRFYLNEAKMKLIVIVAPVLWEKMHLYIWVFLPKLVPQCN